MNKGIKISLMIAGAFDALFLIFHAFFLQPAVALENPACSNHCPALNLGAIVILALMAYLSLLRPGELAEAALGKPLLLAFAVFYLIRIAAEFIFYGFDGAGSLLIIALCALPALIYLFPLISTTSGRKYDPAR